MALSRRHFNRHLLAALGSTLLPVTWSAQASDDDVREGHEWRAITPPQPGDEDGQIEVLEFFSYGCSHCAHLNPLIKDWAAKLPEDVSFRRVPETFGRAAWENLARLYYALEFSQALDRLDQAVFDAVTQERIALYQPRKMLDWLQQQGVDPASFEDIFNGFAVETKVARAKALSEDYQVKAVPMIAVGGRYAVLNNGAKNYGALLTIAERLIDKARQRPPPA
ncbi:thiol:disulfide interchange protein DsbA/DsbL [Rhabdochromatium marinum]|uniref:thiol:disulfide interchange protein DsbA/DsbL n=1 Tax=Rhabdochromatium marinum TaxID=48729 RepID=UPI001903DD60|nr:thiol:disulfide interchange protein DsbA/DsbL [Rhabdochromatium marinum]MBK1648196.1 twin-arginine translocation pathway signal protein [Rhabdochromatium marinum]